MESKENENTNPQEELFFMNVVAPKDRQLGKAEESLWVEEAYLSAVADDSLSNHYVGLGVGFKKLNLFLFVVFVFLIMLFARVVYLQLWRGTEYLSLAERNRIRIYSLPAPRGIIYDRQGVALVKNIPGFSLSLTPVDFPKDPAERQRIRQALEQFFSPEILDENWSNIIDGITAIRKEYFEPQLLVNDVPYETAIKIRLQASTLPGISVDTVSRREYLYSEGQVDGYLSDSLSHLLGYVGRLSSADYDKNKDKGYLFNDFIGKAGIERFYETLLRGEFGRKQVEVDSLGQEKKIIAQDEVQPGASLILALDFEAQAKLESLMRESIQKNQLPGGVAIAMDPRNGEVISLVSLPGYNNNLFITGISATDYETLLNDPSHPLFNRAISGEYPSGSTIKPVVAAAALGEGIITPTTTFLSTGGIRIDKWFFPDWLAGGHGATDVRRALAWSVNTFFYIIGGGYGDFVGLGADKIKEYGEKFGLGQLTNIDLPGEYTGFLPSPEWKELTKREFWYIGDTYHMAIGQGDVLVTPIQVANYTAAIANRGTLYEPHLLKAVISAETKKRDEVSPVILRSNIVSSKNLEVIREGMRQTVTLGSARSLNYLNLDIAGKTGTAQWGTDKRPHAWFTSFAPYENPEIVVTILLEEGVEGSSVAVPVAREFYNWYFNVHKKSL